MRIGRPGTRSLAGAAAGFAFLIGAPLAARFALFTAAARMVGVALRILRFASLGAAFFVAFFAFAMGSSPHLF